MWVNVVAIKPKPAFYPLFDSLGQRPDSKVKVLNEDALRKETGSDLESEPSTVLVETGETQSIPETMLCFV